MSDRLTPERVTSIALAVIQEIKPDFESRERTWLAGPQGTGTIMLKLGHYKFVIFDATWEQNTAFAETFLRVQLWAQSPGQI